MSKTPDSAVSQLPNLTGQVAVVTGGGRGIGQVISQMLGKAGAAVAVLGQAEGPLDETVEAIKAAGGIAASWSVDVTRGTDITRTMAEVEAALGPITLLINNAGTNKGGGPIWLTDPDEWWRAMEINLRGPFLCSRAVLPGMLERGRGRIVNMGSAVGLRAEPMASSYSTSKAALLRLTDCTAVGVEGAGVQVFAVSPGWVWTDMTRDTEKQIRAMDPGFEGIDDQHVYPPEDVATLIARLGTGEADALTGRFIHVADDLDTLIADAENIVTEDRYALRLVQ